MGCLMLGIFFVRFGAFFLLVDSVVVEEIPDVNGYDS